MLPASQRLRLEMDARAGEHAVRSHRAESDLQLQNLWGKADKSLDRQHEAGSHENGQPLAQTPQVGPKPATWKVGERGLGRDPVGEASATRPRQSGTGCSFAGVIELLSAQMQESAITHVECPVCFAVRNIQPKGDYVRFPKHPQRTTSTPNRGWRWVKRGSTWELAD